MPFNLKAFRSALPLGSEGSQVKSEHFDSLKYALWYATTRNAFNLVVFLRRV